MDQALKPQFEGAIALILTGEVPMVTEALGGEYGGQFQDFYGGSTPSKSTDLTSKSYRFKKRTNHLKISNLNKISVHRPKSTRFWGGQRQISMAPNSSAIKSWAQRRR